MRFRPTGSGRPGRIAAGALVGLTLIVLAGVARAACPDTDGDGVCDVDDNCITVPNAEQRDSYGPVGSPLGAFGDACEPITGFPELNVTKVKLRGGAAGRGKASMKGDFILAQGQTFEPSSVSMRFVDGIDLDLVAPDPNGVPAEPSVVCEPLGRSIRCKQPGQKTGVLTVASFVLSSTDDSLVRTVKVNVKVRRLSLRGTAFAEPVTVTLSDGNGTYRVGKIFDCAPRNGQLRCREF